MSRLHADCYSLAKQFHDIAFCVTVWINYPCSPYIATSPSFNPFTGARDADEGPEESRENHHRKANQSIRSNIQSYSVLMPKRLARAPVIKGKIALLAIPRPAIQPKVRSQSVLDYD